jgi:hypothetical protein
LSGPAAGLLSNAADCQRCDASRADTRAYSTAHACAAAQTETLIDRDKHRGSPPTEKTVGLKLAGNIPVGGEHFSFSIRDLTIVIAGKTPQCHVSRFRIFPKRKSRVILALSGSINTSQPLQ